MKKTALIINNLLFDGYLMDKTAVLFDWKFFSHQILNIKHWLSTISLFDGYLTGGIKTNNFD